MTEQERADNLWLMEPISVGEFMALMNELSPNKSQEESRMPAEKAKATNVLKKIAKKLGGAVRNHANDKTTYGLIKLPGGINGGIARLKEIEFGEVAKGKTNEGEPYCRLMGTVREPKMFNGQRVAGLQTSILIMLCDTKNSKGEVTTFDQNVGRLMMELRRLGGEDFTADAEGEEDIQALVDQLLEERPYFRFSTEQGGESIDPKTKKPRPPKVFENWHGSKGLEDYTDDDVGDGVEIEEEEEETPVSKKPSTNGKGKPSVKKAEPEEEEEEEVEDEAEVEDEEEVEEEEAEEEVEEEEETTDEDEEGEEEEDEETPPTKGDVVSYHPVDPKTKKRSKEPADCRIIAVDMKSKTVTLKNLGTKKTYLGIPWSELEG